MKNTILSFVLLSLLASCGHTYNKVVNDPSLRPTHGGRLIEGDDYFVEVVGTEEQIKIYPMKFDEKKKKLVSVPTQEVVIGATYAFLKHEKKAGQDDRPSLKGEASIPLEPRKDGFEGKVKAKDTDGYVVNIKLQDNQDQETFRYKVEI